MTALEEHETIIILPMPSTLSFIYIKYYIREYFISKFVPVTVYLHKRTRIVKNLSLSNRNKNKTCFHKIWGSDIKGISVKQHTRTHTHTLAIRFVRYTTAFCRRRRTFDRLPFHAAATGTVYPLCAFRKIQ